MFASFIFYALTVAAVYRLRRRRPDLPRPYRCAFYPWSPALFIVVAITFVVAQLRDPDKQNNALIGLGILAAGAIVYLLQHRRRQPPPAVSA